MIAKKFEKGLIQIYTGDGKGKTTAAVGQGVRTAGGGYKVLMIQFLKGEDTGELHSIAKLHPDFKLLRFGSIQRFYFTLGEEEKKEVAENIRAGIEKIKELLKGEQYNLLILDEIMAVLSNGIVTADEILALLDSKPDHVEIILTGRNAPKKLIERADYVTEMKMIKHPFEKGIQARKGIEN